tara:strand:+ start:379 stop:894 length:516 start_codon:yes stop_codon:yes gene_type:complete
MNELLLIITILLVYISIQISSRTYSLDVKSDNEKNNTTMVPHSHNIETSPIQNVHCLHGPILKPRIPINIPTRGGCDDYRQIGVLTNNDNSKILPLFGRQIWRGSSKWHYSTQTDKLVSVFLPVVKDGRNCSSEYGCDELYENDDVDVPQLNERFKVTIYNIDGPRYIPYL